MSYVKVNVTGENFCIEQGELKNSGDYTPFGSIGNRQVYKFPGLLSDPQIQGRFLSDISNPGDAVDVMCLTRNAYDALQKVEQDFKDRKVRVVDQGHVALINVGSESDADEILWEDEADWV